jgi:hypothetical protein
VDVELCQKPGICHSLSSRITVVDVELCQKPGIEVVTEVSPFFSVVAYCSRCDESEFLSI